MYNFNRPFYVSKNRIGAQYFIIHFDVLKRLQKYQSYASCSVIQIGTGVHLYQTGFQDLVESQSNKKYS